MEFEALLAHVLALLQRQGRVSYGALKMHLGIDDACLDILKEELLYVHPVVDDDGKGLVWTGDPALSEPDVRHGAEAARRFHTMLPGVMARLRHEGRITYRTLKYVFSLDEAVLEEIREELTFKRLAIDEEGKGLVWTGEPQLAEQPATPAPQDTATARPRASPSPPALVSETSTLFTASTTATDGMSTEVADDAGPETPPDEPVVVPESVRRAPKPNAAN